MGSTYSPALLSNSVVFKNIEINGLNIAYREAGDPSHPKLVLLHGWPASSHQYRDLIPKLSSRFHVIAPDYPGFGNSDAPDPSVFKYTFDKLAEVTEHFLEKKGFDRFGLYVQDYGGPIGFRVVTKKPGSLEWLIIQNNNAYEVGFSEAWDGLRHAFRLDRNETNENMVASLLELESVKTVYLTGSPVPELISPDSWNSDFLLTLQRLHGRKIQMDLLYDYRTNPELYPKWQAFLKKSQPKTVIFWGQGDFFLTPAGGESYLKDLPNADDASAERRAFRDRRLSRVYNEWHYFLLQQHRVSQKQSLGTYCELNHTSFHTTPLDPLLAGFLHHVGGFCETPS